MLNITSVRLYIEIKVIIKFHIKYIDISWFLNVISNWPISSNKLSLAKHCWLIHILYNNMLYIYIKDVIKSKIKTTQETTFFDLNMCHLKLRKITKYNCSRNL